MVSRLAERNRDEETPVAGKDARELTERSLSGAVVRLLLDPVDAVVGTDVLERGDEQDLVERAIGERKRADVRLDRLQSLHVALCEIDAHELDVRSKERREIRRLGEGVPDVEHAPFRAKT